MKKIIIFIFLIGAFINHSYGQKGITAHYIRSGDFLSARSGPDFETTSGNGFALGYMYYKNDRQFKQLKFSFIGSSAEEVRDTYHFNGQSEEITYQDRYSTFIFSYEKYNFWGKAEMDDPNIWYGYRAWDLMYDVRSYDISNTDEQIYLVKDVKERSRRLSNVDVAFRIGLGFQHNFSHKVGAFIDFNAGIRFINFGYVANTNIGVRMNLE